MDRARASNEPHGEGTVEIHDEMEFFDDLPRELRDLLNYGSVKGSATEVTVERYVHGHPWEYWAQVLRRGYDKISSMGREKGWWAPVPKMPVPPRKARRRR